MVAFAAVCSSTHSGMHTQHQQWAAQQRSPGHAAPVQLPTHSHRSCPATVSCRPTKKTAATQQSTEGSHPGRRHYCSTTALGSSLTCCHQQQQGGSCSWAELLVSPLKHPAHLVAWMLSHTSLSAGTLQACRCSRLFRVCSRHRCSCWRSWQGTETRLQAGQGSMSSKSKGQHSGAKHSTAEPRRGALRGTLQVSTSFPAATGCLCALSPCLPGWPAGVEQMVAKPLSGSRYIRAHCLRI